ncbi:MAG: hypothetical protein VX288_03015 [Planctomycetota bacterium]|nr:hypothetical protein [Planctomycetota bacterium]
MSIPVTLESGNLAQLDEGREILTYSRLPGLRKVAILFRSLVLQDAGAAQALLDSLNSMEQVMVKEELDSMGVLEPDTVTDVLREFDVLCDIHTAYRDRGVDGAISVGEKYLHSTQARRLALALGSGQDSGEEPVSEALDMSREEPGEITEAETGPEPVDETSGDALELNDSGETPADPESLSPSRQEEKDLEDVVS